MQEIVAYARQSQRVVVRTIVSGETKDECGSWMFLVPSRPVVLNQGHEMSLLLLFLKNYFTRVFENSNPLENVR